MKALLLYPYLPFPGVTHGSGRVVAGLIRELRARCGVHVTLVAGGGTLAERDAMRGAVDAYFPFDRVDVAGLDPVRRVVEMGRTAWHERVLGTPRFAAKMLRASFREALAAALRAGPFDVVQAEIGGLAGIADALSASLPKVLVDHEAGTPTGGTLADEPETRAWVRRTYAAWDRVAALTEADARVLADVLGREVAVRPVGVEVPPQDVAVEPDTVLFFGSAEHRPNLDALQRLADGIWPKVRAAHPRAELRVAIGTMPSDLEAALDRVGIRRLGFVHDIHACVARSAVVVAPVRRGGGIRIKNLEALAGGRPLVTTTLGASGIGIVDGLHARVVDDDDGFAEAVVDLLRRPTDAEALGRRGRAWVTTRCSHAVAAEWTVELWRGLRRSS